MKGGGKSEICISRMGRPISTMPSIFLIDGKCDKYVMDGSKLEHDIVAECREESIRIVCLQQH
jgi:hypothetical protein